jgi:hypothetical protein
MTMVRCNAMSAPVEEEESAPAAGASSACVAVTTNNNIMPMRMVRCSAMSWMDAEAGRLRVLVARCDLPQPCSGRLMTPAAGWRGASMPIHMYQHLLSLARGSNGLSALFVARPVVRLAVTLPMVRLVARSVYLRRSPAAPGPWCVPAAPSMVLEEPVDRHVTGGLQE